MGKGGEKVNTGKMAAQTAYLLGAKQKKEAIGIEHDPFGVLATDRYLYQNGKDQIRKGGGPKKQFRSNGQKTEKTNNFVSMNFIWDIESIREE